ncbi:hypothetical protein PGT21_031625 [Puccinia graminis f. sp. tritici]|uniref:Secreted protein n=1 Tax=Puccinia graminis f. sp. tritici TaxID=56615 RepID=A0A5B0P259_PUCGR|nr:hypothetical protein PGT21_031625 [Puccinia graminis f. sp. tritici]KAA1095647.1 hypothetical protein PGTUg99_015398 [Puccinia graminis f. sp. tritici]
MYGPHIITLCFLTGVIPAGLRLPRTCEICEKDLSYNERHSLMVSKSTGRRCPKVTLCSGGYWHECHQFELGYYGLCSVCQMVTQPRYIRCSLDHDNQSAVPCQVHPIQLPTSASAQDSPLSLPTWETQPPTLVQDA